MIYIYLKFFPVDFLNLYEMCSKFIETGVVFTEKEINNQWNVSFLQSKNLGIQNSYSSLFYIICRYTVVSSLNAIRVIKSLTLIFILGSKKKKVPRT